MNGGEVETVVLSAVEARILGSLMEKETTTPEAYPLSMNGLLAAANQKSSREPVMQVTEREAGEALRSLEDKGLVAVDHGSRVERFENRARTVFHLRRDETALLCLLLLRGPQTPGELRGRAERLFAFDDVNAVLAALQRMSTATSPAQEGSARGAMVAALPRQPGSREPRYAHLLSGPPAALPEPETTPRSATVAANEVLSAEMVTLRAAVDRLERRVASLEAALGVSEDGQN